MYRGSNHSVPTQNLNTVASDFEVGGAAKVIWRKESVSTGAMTSSRELKVHKVFFTLAELIFDTLLLSWNVQLYVKFASCNTTSI